jgi:hypothetical protein
LSDAVPPRLSGLLLVEYVELEVGEEIEIVGGVVSGGAVTVTLPPEPLQPTGLPDASEAVIPLIETGILPGGVAAPMVNWTVATVPEPIEFWFMPNMRMRIPPALGFADADLPALDAAEPVEILL